MVKNRVLEKSHLNNYQVLLKMGRFVKPYTSDLVFIFLSLTIAAGTMLSFGIGLQNLIDYGFILSNPSMLTRSIFIIVGMSLVIAGASFVRSYYSSSLSEKVVVDIKSVLFSHLLKLPPSFFESYRSGELISRMSTDMSQFQIVIGSSASTAFRNLLQLLGALILIFMTSIKLATILLVMIPVILLPIVWLGKKVRKLSKISQDQIADDASYVQETFSAIETVQSNHRERLHQAVFKHSLEETLQAIQSQNWVRSTMVALVIALVFSSVSFVLWLGGYDVLSGKLSAGSLSSFIFYAVVAAGSVNQLIEIIGDLNRAIGASERLLELLAIESDIIQANPCATLPRPALGGLEFSNVSFSYPTRSSQKALDNFTLSIQPGEKVALVGPSGGGKSTLFKLLLRFYDPHTGSIKLDGIDIRKLSFKDLRETLAIVPQDPFIFNASVSDNIAYGKFRATERQIRHAAEAAHAGDFIRSLPDGFNTILGERGVRLSGGQRQRLAIARAIIRDPAILLLDEATNALDAESERIVQMALKELMKDRTTLIVAHRLSTIQSADQIVVINDGKIESIGSHEALLEEKGLYQKLATLQLADAA